MIKATVNGKSTFTINRDTQLTCNNEAVDWSAARLPSGDYSIIMDGHSYQAQVLKVDRDTKTVVLQINQQPYEIAIEEPIDQLLASMGIKDALTKKINDIKAPMPGLVLKVLVTPGQAIRKGDPVLILEAMKMENVFKSGSDAIVKEIKVTERTAVEKGEVLIVLE
ncbi:acetyl-CoA carboxylase biotin carboxyl carrier protein subunit [Chitinophaga nivalis]|uniref:Acetyl-CoA carboxylase biotin carboxyl carrier protein subunit n=1 Tax=Chitinophaga nivalis TaxID=2991709 RepID=A0ABT3IXP0_9BACT|nr:acetyl-CoA carboxylase biotin carboxyl carrier protein subunit [Chitinophaga nivalis]MCW3461807.1 acetyl-CoA carboxylase biotin carboxyl carrier protein subunit [Chitinophaga nivalis]MCW3488499.1 acetyl-CoA carboxylase biotin carboxyl carrier protein subunit [Chitinophaga nivalis]